MSVIFLTNEDMDQIYKDMPGKKGEGENSVVFNNSSSHATAENTSAFGEGTTASAKDAFATGCDTVASGICSHAEGNNTYATSNCAHAEGYNTFAEGTYSHAEGSFSHALGDYSHAEGYTAYATSFYDHAEGYQTTAGGGASHAEGGYTRAEGIYSHAEGNETWAYGPHSHAEGNNTTAKSNCAHAEGYYSCAEGDCSHAEGYQTLASGLYSHVEGYQTAASGWYSHAEGYKTTAVGLYSHAEGYQTTAVGDGAHAEGQGTYAYGYGAHSEGKYNIINYDQKYAHIVGNGTSDDKRSNAHTLDWDGNAEFAGDVVIYGCKNKDSSISIGSLLEEPSTSYLERKINYDLINTSYGLSFEFESSEEATFMYDSFHNGDAEVFFEVQETDAEEYQGEVFNFSYQTSEYAEFYYFENNTLYAYLYLSQSSDEKVLTLTSSFYSYGYPPSISNLKGILNIIAHSEGGIKKLPIIKSEAITSEVPRISIAQPGQFIAVKTVDENGKPTEWEAADKPTGGGFTESDKAELVTEVLNALPTWQGGAY